MVGVVVIWANFSSPMGHRLGLRHYSKYLLEVQSFTVILQMVGAKEWIKN